MRVREAGGATERATDGLRRRVTLFADAKCGVAGSDRCGGSFKDIYEVQVIVWIVNVTAVLMAATQIRRETA